MREPIQPGLATEPSNRRNGNGGFHVRFTLKNGPILWARLTPAFDLKQSDSIFGMEGC